MDASNCRQYRDRLQPGLYEVAESRLNACKTSVRRSGGPRVHLLIGNNAHFHPSMLVVTPDHLFVDAKSASM